MFIFSGLTAKICFFCSRSFGKTLFIKISMTLSGSLLRPIKLLTQTWTRLSSLLKLHVFGLQLGCKMKWRYKIQLFSHSVFKSSKKYLPIVLDNEGRELQGHGFVQKSHDDLSFADIMTLYESPEFPHNHAKGLMSSPNFNIAFLKAFSPGDVAYFRVNDVTRTSSRDSDCTRIVKVAGGCQGSSKNRQKGFAVVDYKHPDALIWNKTQGFELVNVFQNTKAYLKYIFTFQKKHEKVFCAVNHRHSVLHQFLENQKLGHWPMQKYLFYACNECETKSKYNAHAIVSHGLRDIMTTCLLEADLSDTCMILKSIYCNHRPFAAHRKIQGCSGS